MLRRHWLLLSLWTGLFALMLAGILSSGENKSLLGFPLIISPFVALVTVIRLFRRKDVEPFRHRWAIAQRIAVGLCVLCALGGLVASASQFVQVEGSTTIQNGPMALLFLLSLIGSYSALVRPSPRNTALPAPIVHIGWLPLFVANNQTFGHIELWQKAVIGLSLLGLLVASAISSMIALGAYTGEPARVPEARQL